MNQDWSEDSIGASIDAGLGASAGRIRRGETTICILGMGHVGLPTALGLAELGWDVIGADNDADKMALLKSGRCPFYEPRLEELLQKHIANSRLKLTGNVEAAIRSAQVLVICVWTSQRANGEADLAHIEALARVIARNLNGYKLIVEKSTVPAGTGQCIKKTIERYFRAARGGKTNGSSGSGTDAGGARPIAVRNVLFDVASSPEFLQEGRAVEDILHPSRIVCGTDSERAAQILRELYRSYQCPVIVTDLNTSEIMKHAANAFLATKISFINMIADLCEAIGGDVAEVARGIGLDPRIGPEFLNAGIGFGGYCLPKDLRALIHLAGEHGVSVSFLKEVERINLQRIGNFLGKVREALWILRGKTVGVLGLAFKPGTDDIRGAPSIPIIEGLLQDGARLQLHDPRAARNFRALFPEQDGRISYHDSPYDAARGAHALLLLTEWEEFRSLDLAAVRDAMEVPVLVDGRNFFDPRQVREAGIEYRCMGRESAKARPDLVESMAAAL